MNTFPAIHKPLAFFALLLILLSAAPKKYVHDLVAGHEDFYSELPGDDPAISNTAFDCHIHDLVVAMPFVVTTFPNGAAADVTFTLHPQERVSSIGVLPRTTEDSRGPPGFFD